MEVGTRVFYKGEEYILIFDYNNGQLEIKKVRDKYTVECFNKSDVQVIKE